MDQHMKGMSFQLITKQIHMRSLGSLIKPALTLIVKKV